MRIFGISLLSILFTLLTCCTGCKKNVSTTDNAVTFDSIRLQETYHLFNDTAKPSCNLQINFIYPADYSNPNILKSLQTIFVGKYFGDNFSNKTPQEAIVAYKDQYLASYKQFEQEHNTENGEQDFEDEELGASFSYYETSHNTIVFNKDGILSFSIFFENYTGGAHGSHALSGYVIDMNTGKLLTEKDIFCEDCQEKIADIIIRKIAEQNNVSTPQELENIGYSDVEEMAPNGNFLIDEKGITYIFNEYEIAPYVMGRTEVLLPFDEINIYINKKSAIAPLAF